jgi:ATP-dependent Clp protease adaptor protein ClpS
MTESATTVPATIESQDLEALTRTLRFHRLMLHNDDVNSMEHVVESLLVCVPELEPEQAVAVMLEAHEQGVAQVLACPLERAELYRDRLWSQGLTATIESD